MMTHGDDGGHATGASKDKQKHRVGWFTPATEGMKEVLAQATREAGDVGASEHLRRQLTGLNTRQWKGLCEQRATYKMRRVPKEELMLSETVLLRHYEAV
jgi:hypothetical protein